MSAIPTPVTYAYKTAGGLALEADVYAHGAVKRRPAILWLHGGALVMGSRASTPPGSLLERLLDAGYAVVSVDYRLAPETQLAAIAEDVEDAHRWLATSGLDLFGADPARNAIAGMSAGAYLTLLAGGRVEPKPKALVSFYGYGDITGDWYTAPSPFYCAEYPAVTRERAYADVSGPPIAGAPDERSMRGRPEFYLYCRQNGLWPQAVTGHDPVTDRAWFRDYEPLRNVTPAYPPTLLLHGEKDTDVPFKQSVAMAAELRRNHIDHALVSNPEWGHAFDYADNDPTIADAFDRVTSFLAENLGSE